MKVRASIELIPTESGGAGHPLRGCFRPNHRFGSDDFVVGEVEQAPDEVIAPGECANRIVAFLPDGLPMLLEGTQWEIFEGPQKLIGHGRVLELLEG